MRHLVLIATLLFAGNVSAAQCTAHYNGGTLSFWASQGNLAAVKSLVNGGCSVDSTSPPRSTMSVLFESFGSSDPKRIEILAWITPRGANSDATAPDCTDLHKGKPLYYWASQGDLGAIKILINGGCDVNATSSADTPLVAAIKSKRPGTLDVIKWLIEKGVDVELQDSFNRYPLMYAAIHDNKDAAMLLFRAVDNYEKLLSATDNKRFSNGTHPYGARALQYARAPDIFGFLVSFDWHYRAIGRNLSAWHTAAEYMTEAYGIDQLESLGVHKSWIYHFHYYSSDKIVNALMLAAEHDRPSQILRRYVHFHTGTDLELTLPGDYRTALHYAARSGHVANVRQLIKGGAKVNAGRDVSGGMSPIFAAVEAAKSIERTKVVKALVAAGGKVTDASGNKPSISDDHKDAAALRAIIDDPRPYFPTRAYVLGIAFNPPSPAALATTSWLDIGCHEASDSCLVYFDCTDDNGAKTGSATLSAGAVVTYSDSASSPNTTTIAGQLGLGSDENWKGRLDCALRSLQRISAQIWSKTGTTLVDNTDYIQSDKNKEAILQKVHPQGSSQRMAMRIRCIDKLGCKSTVVGCRSATGTTAPNMSINVGNIDNLKTTVLYNYARGDDASNFPTGIASCTVKSKGSFLVQVLTNSNGVLLNHTGISME